MSVGTTLGVFNQERWKQEQEKAAARGRVLVRGKSKGQNDDEVADANIFL